MQRATRVLVANRPKLMREVILSALVDQPGIEIFGEVSEEKDILPQVQATLPDLLVIALDEGEQQPAICERVLREHPELRIIAVASRKDRTLYFWNPGRCTQSGRGHAKAFMNLAAAQSELV